VSPPHHAELYTLSLHDALPIYPGQEAAGLRGAGREVEGGVMSHLSDLQIDQGLMQGSMPAHAGECERCRRRWEELARDREAFRRSEEHTSELQSRFDIVCRLLL